MPTKHSIHAAEAVALLSLSLSFSRDGFGEKQPGQWGGRRVPKNTAARTPLTRWNFN